MPAATRVELRVSNDCPGPSTRPGARRAAVDTRVVSARPSTTHRATLADLAPGTRYAYRLALCDAASDEAVVWSDEYAFTTTPPARRKVVLRVPVRVMLLTNVIDTASLSRGSAAEPEASQPSAPAGPPASMPVRDVQMYYTALGEVQLFWWMNSAMMCWVDFDVLLDQTCYRAEPCGAAAPDWCRRLPELNVPRAAAAAARAAGRTADPPAIELVYEARRRFDPASGEWQYLPYHATSEPPSRDTPAQSHFLGIGDLSWSTAFALKQSLDQQYARSGLTAEDDRLWCFPLSPAFDDPATPQIDWPHDTAGDHGDAWNALAWQLQRFTGEQYLRNRWGEILLVDDADGDGYPDRDERLPLDEYRVAADPTLVDSDGDGMSDLREMMFFTWAPALIGDARWRARAAYIQPNLLSADADGDGLPDGGDPYPLYPYRAEVPERNVSIDGNAADWAGIDPIEFRQRRLGRLREMVHLSISLCHDADWLYVCVVPHAPYGGLRLRLDARGDGWFRGRDNVVVELSPEALITRLAVRRADQPRWPFEDESGELLRIEDLQSAAGPQGEQRVVELAIPKKAGMGLEMTSGSRIGVAIDVRLPSGTEVSVFEPYAFFKPALAGAAD